MIDLHCHVHFGIDDGPQTASASKDLLWALKDAGVTTVACTSHVRSDKAWWNVKDKQRALFDRLNAEVLDDGRAPTCVPAAEHYLDAELMAEGFEDRVVPYGTTKTMLVEMPYQGMPPDLLGLLFTIRRRGFYVLLAHVERYPYVCDDDDMLDRLTSAGHLIQVNLGSLAGAYTRGHKKAAERLVSTGMASVVSSDCHEKNDVKRYLLDGKKALGKLVGNDGVHRLTITNPQKILDGVGPERIWP